MYQTLIKSRFLGVTIHRMHKLVNMEWNKKSWGHRYNLNFLEGNLWPKHFPHFQSLWVTRKPFLFFFKITCYHLDYNMELCKINITMNISCMILIKELGKKMKVCSLRDLYVIFLGMILVFFLNKNLGFYW